MRGIRHATETVRWETGDRQHGIQERARDHRYEILSRMCVERGLKVLLTAHHEDDNLETLFLRLQRQSGLEGLACISHSRYFKTFLQAGATYPASVARIQLCRPLLAFPKARLEATCRAAGMSWAEDPSNATDKYARNAVRHALQGLYPGTSLRDDAAALMRGAAVYRHRLGALLAIALAECARLDPLLGTGRISRAALAQFDVRLQAMVVSRTVQCVAGTGYPLASAHVAAITALLTRKGSAKQAVGGCIVALDYAHVYVYRQPPPRQHRVSVPLTAAAAGAWWDGRFLVRLTQISHADAKFALRFLDKEDLKITRGLGPPEALQGLPVIECEHMRLAALPHLGRARCGCVATEAVWEPRTDMVSSDFTDKNNVEDTW
jgi:tRNA(Ile)-lysidine synthase